MIKYIFTLLLCLLIGSANGSLISSGTTAVATTDDTAVTALAADTSQAYLNEMVIINEGSAPGFFSIDGGTVWARLPAGPSSVRIQQRQAYQGVKVKRVSGGTNLSGIYVWAD